MNSLNCKNCGEKVDLEGSKLVTLVFKEGSRFYTCSPSCGEDVLNDEGL